ncbi:hypothetical protein D9Q98_004083 [Chlorella vulgaris]|uniref:J domain-containing protein n=1 Tax=Chlorella vulgaris TaxID=3077 RepID=A0A9D4YXS2_CHLVU|nr:hypothetical protein D9Q98_004083 [Chlorella vulgaris]
MESIDGKYDAETAINPFDLLGVTYRASPEEVRRAYYTLACMCHPDRGGTDGEMRTVHNAYEYVMVNVRANKTTRLEDLEQDFHEFCKTQTEAPPPLADIHADTIEAEKFHSQFTMPATPGYSVVASEYANADIENLRYNSVVLSTGDELPAVKPSQNVSDIVARTLDFTVGSSLCDYREALVSQAPYVPDGFEPPTVSLEEYQRQRDAFDKGLPYEMGPPKRTLDDFLKQRHADDCRSRELRQHSAT